MKQNFDNSPENILQNIADDLSTISGTCAEIKETQLNCATNDDLDNMGKSITSAVIEKVDTMQSSIVTQTTTVKEIGENLTTSVDNLKTEIAEKLTISPPILRYRRLRRQSASPKNRGRYISPCSSQYSL